MLHAVRLGENVSQRGANMEVRAAGEQDVEGLLELAQEFIAESGYGWTYSEHYSRWVITQFTTQEGRAFYVADPGDGTVAGCVLVGLSYDWVEEPVAHLVTFYVRAPWRGSWAGRKLIAAATQWADAQGAEAMFATSTAMIGAGKAFENLCGRYGFASCGPTLMRTPNNG